MTLRLAAVALALTLALPADARMHAGPGQLTAGHRLQGMIAPLDGGGSFGTPAAAYSLRRLKSTYAGPAVKLRRASDNATQDINFLGFTGFTGAPIDVAAAATFCAATTCWFDTWYDQSGNGRDQKQATLANQPAYIANCNGTLPCARVTGATQLMGTAASYAYAALASLNSVANRSVGTGQCYWIDENAKNFWFVSGVGANWAISDGVGSVVTAAADAAWHAGVGIFAGASSLVRVDGIESTGSVAGGAQTGPTRVLLGAASTTCSEAEAVVWDNYALTTVERAALTANQRQFWGF